MAKNQWFGTWVLATLSLLDIRQGRPSHSAETRQIKCTREALSVSGRAKTGRVWLNFGRPLAG